MNIPIRIVESSNPNLTSSIGSHLDPVHVESRVKDGIRIQESLFIQDNRVLWYVDDTFHVSFGFEKEKILHALFAWLPFPSLSGATMSAASRDSHSDNTLERVLVIISNQEMKLYLSNGENFIVNLPFQVHKAYPLSYQRGGILLERKQDPNETNLDPTVNFPSLFAVTDVFLEPRAIYIDSDVTGTLTPFNHKIGSPKYVSDEYLVSWDPMTSSISIFTFSNDSMNDMKSHMEIDWPDDPDLLKPTNEWGHGSSTRTSPLFFSMDKVKKASIRLVHVLCHRLESSDNLTTLLTIDWNKSLVLFVFDKNDNCLYGYSVNQTNKVLKSILSVPALDVVPVSSFRPNHTDIFYFDKNGNPSIWLGSPNGQIMSCHLINEVGFELDEVVGSKRPGIVAAEDMSTGDKRTDSIGEAFNNSKTRFKRFVWQCGGYVGIEFHYSGVYTASIDLSPRSDLVRSVFDMLTEILDTPSFYSLSLGFIQSAFSQQKNQTTDEWEYFVDSLYEFLGSPKRESSFQSKLSAGAFEWLNLLDNSRTIRGISFVHEARTLQSHKVVESLQILYEDLLLQNASYECESKLGRLLSNLATLLCMPSYSEYLWKRGTCADEDLTADDPVPNLNRPFSISEWLLYEFSHAKCDSTDQGVPSHCQLTLKICQLARRFRSCSKKQEAVSILEECLLVPEILNKLSLGVRVLVWQIIYMSEQAFTSSTDPSPALSLPSAALKRIDILLQSRPFAQRGDHSLHESTLNAYSIRETTATSSNIISSQLQSESLSHLLSLRFVNDELWKELAQVLSSSPDAVLDVPNLVAGASDEKIAMEQQSVLQLYSRRVFAQAFGRGIFLTETSTILPTEKIAISNVVVKAKMPPFNSSISLQLRPGESLEWPDFHQGVAEGLKIRADAIDIDSSWIVFNQATNSDGTITIDAKHAGFVLGLGLTGHLKKIEFADSLRYYLLPQNELLSIGILLGLSVSYYGSRDQAITQMLAVHIPSMLPPDSMELVSAGSIKSVAILGYGLVHAGSCMPYQLELLLNELKSIKMSALQHMNSSNETYALSCGFALGFVAINDRDNMYREWTFKDDNLALELLSLTKGQSSLLVGAASTIALGLAYMMSNKASVASRIFIPTNAYLLDSIRPNDLMLNILSKSLIMWDSIRPKMDYIWNNIPAFLHVVGKQNDLHTLDGLLIQSYFACLSGLCMSIGLKLAGTKSADAQALLKDIFQRLSKDVLLIAETYTEKLVKRSKIDCLCTVAIAACMVSAGSGDQDMLHGIKKLIHLGQKSEWQFGHQTMMHMALGLLFMGGGMMTLGSSKRAVAACLCAFYPKFAVDSMDHTGYLHAFRHLWVLAVEKRGIRSYDGDLKSAISVPIEIHLNDGTKPMMTTPCLLPDTKDISHITVVSPRYNQVTYELSQTLKQGVQGHVIWVKRKMGHLPYHEDPHGQKGIDMISIPKSGDASRTKRAVESFVQSVSSDPQILALVKHVCHSDGFDTTTSTQEMREFCTDVLHKCLSQNKPFMVGIYLSLYRLQGLIQSCQITATQILDLMVIRNVLTFVSDSFNDAPLILEVDFIHHQFLLLDDMFLGAYEQMRPALVDYLENGVSSDITNDEKATRLAAAYVTYKSWPYRCVLLEIRSKILELQSGLSSFFTNGTTVPAGLHQHMIALELSREYSHLSYETITSIVQVVL